VLARAADYINTYIMLSLGCKEGNPLISYFITIYGIQNGLLFAVIPTFLICCGFVYIVFKTSTWVVSLLVTCILSVLICISLIVAVGNIAGLALVVYTTIGK
jgi:hypothetical protein